MEDLTARCSIPLELKILDKRYVIKGVVVYIQYKDGRKPHYISYIYKNGMWYEYNDSIVTVYQSMPRKVNSHCMLLFYEKIDNEI